LYILSLLSIAISSFVPEISPVDELKQ
jgi:hypothetical protein